MYLCFGTQFSDSNLFNLQKKKKKSLEFKLEKFLWCLFCWFFVVFDIFIKKIIFLLEKLVKEVKKEIKKKLKDILKMPILMISS